MIQMMEAWLRKSMFVVFIVIYLCVRVFASLFLRKESPKLQEAVPMSPMPMPGKGKAPQMYNQSAWLIECWTAKRPVSK